MALSYPGRAHQTTAPAGQLEPDRPDGPPSRAGADFPHGLAGTCSGSSSEGAREMAVWPSKSTPRCTLRAEQGTSRRTYTRGPGSVTHSGQRRRERRHVCGQTSSHSKRGLPNDRTSPSHEKD